MPVDRIAVVSWILAAFIFANVGKPIADQWRMLKDWSLFALLLFAYDYSRGLADQLGRPVDFTVTRNVDRALFLGHDPNVWIQQHLNISPNLAWYEYPLAVTYMTHFIVPIGVAVTLWVRNRAEWVRFMRRLGLLLAAGVVTYVIFPVAPPWMAARNGYLAPIRRITARAWSQMGLSTVSKVFDRGAAITNPVAAFPSLHAAFALLVVVFFWRKMPPPLRVTALVLPASMALSLVYFGEHYVTDILVGWLYVWLVLWIAHRWERRLVVA
ncbi:MAG: phosphatase PAP2 family protein [Ilumatobacteraceae bacterium]